MYLCKFGIVLADAINKPITLLYTKGFLYVSNLFDQAVSQNIIKFIHSPNFMMHQTKIKYHSFMQKFNPAHT